MYLASENSEFWFNFSMWQAVGSWNWSSSSFFIFFLFFFKHIMFHFTDDGGSSTSHLAFLWILFFFFLQAQYYSSCSFLFIYFYIHIIIFLILHYRIMASIICILHLGSIFLNSSIDAFCMLVQLFWTPVLMCNCGFFVVSFFSQFCLYELQGILGYVW